MSNKSAHKMTKVFAVINLSPDSFSGDGTTDVKQIEKLIELAALHGMYGVDAGAVSSRPNTEMASEEQETERLKILPHIVKSAHALGLKVSLDSFRPGPIRFGIDCGIDYVNDTSGLCNSEIIRLIAQNKQIRAICMHNLGLPARSDIIIEKSLDVAQVVIDWTKNKIEQLETYGVEKNRVVIDIGIGFGKDMDQCFELIKNFSKIRRGLTCELYVGHSRKSFLRGLAGENMQKRDIASAIIAHHLVSNGCDYLRMHDCETARMTLNLQEKIS